MGRWRVFVLMFAWVWTPSLGLAQTAAPTTAGADQTKPRITAYTLPPALLEKAQHLSRYRLMFTLSETAYSLLLLWLLLRFRIAVRFRDLSERWCGCAVNIAIILPIDILNLSFDGRRRC